MSELWYVSMETGQIESTCVARSHHTFYFLVLIILSLLKSIYLKRTFADHTDIYLFLTVSKQQQQQQQKHVVFRRYLK